MNDDILKPAGHSEEELGPEVSEALQRLKEGSEARARLSQPVWEMLNWAAKRVGYEPPRSGITYVLSVNSGFATDMVALNSYFGNRANGITNEATHVYAVERSTPQHEEGYKLNSRLTYRNKEFVTEPPDYFHFINADPVELSSLALPGQFHAVVIRHPDISNKQYPWDRIIHDALDMLAPGGVAVITTFNNSMEDIPLRRFFFDKNYEVLLHDTNPHAEVIEGKAIALDAIVTVVRKAADYRTPPAPAIPEGYVAGTVDEVITREVFAFPLREMAATEA